MKRRDFLKLIGASLVAPTVLAAIPQDEADESVEYTFGIDNSGSNDGTVTGVYLLNQNGCLIVLERAAYVWSPTGWIRLTKAIR